MPAIRKDLVADAGSTFRLSVQYNDSNEVPVDLTGYQAWLMIQTPKDTEIASLSGTVGSDGWINFKVDEEVTALWPLGRQNYRLALRNLDGDSDRLFFGVLNVRGNAL